MSYFSTVNTTANTTVIFQLGRIARKSLGKEKICSAKYAIETAGENFSDTTGILLKYLK